MKRLAFISLACLLAGCFPYPAKIAMPLRTRVVDASTGLPISGAMVLRVIHDLHDFGCSNVILDRGLTDEEGRIDLAGKRKWRIVIPAPGGLPVPNHQVAIWKDGYLAFVFSRYGDIDDLRACRGQDLVAALGEIPEERRVHTPAVRPEKALLDGEVTLEQER